MNKDNKDNNPVEIPDVRVIRFFDDDDTEYKHPLTEAPFVSYKFIMQTLDDTAKAFDEGADEKDHVAVAVASALNRVGATICRAVVACLIEVINNECERSLLNK